MSKSPSLLLCKAHEGELAQALLSEGLGSDALRDAEAIFVAQARENAPGEVIAAMRAAAHTPQSCLICRFAAPEWIALVTSDLKEFHQGRKPSND